MNRQFIYTIPESILFDPDLGANDLKIYMIVRSFMDTTGDAYPSNNWIASKLKIHRTKVIDRINNLVSKGYLERVIINGKRHLRTISNPIDQDLLVAPTLPPSSDNATPPSSDNATHIISNIINTKIINKEKENTRARKQKSIIAKNEYQDTVFQNSYGSCSSTDLTIISSTSTALTVDDQNSFEEFWKIYPRKTGKERAKAQWFHDGCHLRAAEIIQKLKDQNAKDKTFLDGYSPNPHKYIIEKRYQDEVFEGKKVKKGFDLDSNDWALSSRRSIFEMLK